MGVCRVMGLLGGVLLLASGVGCGDEDGVGSGQPDDVVPFARLPAEEPDISPDEETAPPEMPECTADLLTFEVVTDAQVLGGDPGMISAENRNLALMARPGESCGLSAWPTLRLATSDGEHEEGLVLEPADSRPPGDRLVLAGPPAGRRHRPLAQLVRARGGRGEGRGSTGQRRHRVDTVAGPSGL